MDFYYMERLQINKIHQLGYTGKGIKVVVIDSGCDYKHKDIKNLLGGINLTTENNNNKYNYMDTFGHGTHVTGLVSRVAPDCKIIVCKCMDKTGNGSLIDVKEAFDFAIKQSPDIINLSIGSRRTDSDLEKLLIKAVENNICVVCAAGNDGHSGRKKEVAYPAGYYEAISVGSCTKDHRPSFFSNTNKMIDLLTYGEDIWSTVPNGGYDTGEGTSQAAPIVSGVLCLMAQYLKEKGECTEKKLYEMLINNTTALWGAEESSQGYGILELSNFVRMIKE